jgi:plastocyanin
MRRPSPLAAVAVLLLATGCFSDKPAPAEPAPSPTGDVQASATANVFSPQIVTISKGGTVTWTFGSRTHNVTFIQVPGVPQNVPSTSNNSATRTFTTTGTFAYACTIHPGMIGTVIVK